MNEDNTIWFWPNLSETILPFLFQRLFLITKNRSDIIALFHESKVVKQQRIPSLMHLCLSLLLKDVTWSKMSTESWLLFILFLSNAHDILQLWWSWWKRSVLPHINQADMQRMVESIIKGHSGKTSSAMQFICSTCFVMQIFLLLLFGSCFYFCHTKRNVYDLVCFYFIIIPFGIIIIRIPSPFEKSSWKIPQRLYPTNQFFLKI